MTKNAVKLKLDIIFKKTFTEHDDLLRGLLSGLLEIKSIENITIRNSEILPDGIDGKFVRMDINLEADGKLINVEMQYGIDVNYKDRSLFYWSRLCGGGIKRGSDYDELQPCISINIVNQNVFDCAEYHSCFTMMEKARHEILSDKCEIHYFELHKIGKAIDKSDIMRLWLQLINAETEEELVMLEQTGFEPIQKAVRVIRDMSEDTRIREMARAREEAWISEALRMGAARKEGMLEGEEKGMQKGIQKGIKEGLEIAAESMRKCGMSEDEIERVLNLSSKNHV
ncbi:MAG: Rpn family recombination-promoting nuclease/putative transposase [Oscillospiraceae bacterium]|nr:Rpn family recombination-promoting nuclease/putative transposase [Oscillospiraceae bacterium]